LVLTASTGRLPDDDDGVTLDAPPSIGTPHERSTRSLKPTGSNKVAYLVHTTTTRTAGASSLFGKDVADRDEKPGGLLLRDDDPNRPALTRPHRRRTL
jgi:hypothetical protein